MPDSNRDQAHAEDEGNAEADVVAREDEHERQYRQYWSQKPLSLPPRPDLAQGGLDWVDRFCHDNIVAQDMRPGANLITAAL